MRRRSLWESVPQAAEGLAVVEAGAGFADALGVLEEEVGDGFHAGEVGSVEVAGFDALGDGALLIGGEDEGEGF